MNQKDRKPWLDSLKVKDTIAVDVGRYGGKFYRIETIEKITPKRQFRVSGIDKMFDQNGRCSPDRFFYYTMLPLTDEIKNIIRKRTLLSKIQTFDFEKLDLEQLEKISKIMSQKNSGV